MFYFIRHGETDYSQKNTKIYQNFGVNLSPLTQKGIAQIRETAKDPRLVNPDIILSSPYTRAVQTAAILSKELHADIQIETELHEWLADKTYHYADDKTAQNAYHEYIQFNGTRTADEQQWEEAADIRKRVLPILKKYSHYHKVIIACHGLMIQALCGSEHLKNGEIAELNLDERYEI